MPKPIIIARANWNQGEAVAYRKRIDKELNNQYFVLCVKADNKEPVFEVFNTDDLPQITKKYLQELLLEAQTELV